MNERAKMMDEVVVEVLRLTKSGWLRWRRTVDPECAETNLEGFMLSVRGVRVGSDVNVMLTMARNGVELGNVVNTAGAGELWEMAQHEAFGVDEKLMDFLRIARSL
ncbi:MAG: hypothetical protein A2W26_00535 [Acidobacteria bacterium RBG_16_64_8]|nr:MAG: hypothetical protein A2W26_00535 [Acidobacteria bacterium RBG_16_64_8]